MFLVLTICLRKFLWNESIFLLSAFERDHSSQLYKNTGATKHKKLLSLDVRGLWLVHKIVLYLLNVAQANCFLLFISSEFPNRDPRNLHFFQSSFPFLFILYSSVLSSFTSRFLSFSSFAAISFMLSIFYMLDVLWTSIGCRLCMPIWLLRLLLYHNISDNTWKKHISENNRDRFRIQIKLKVFYLLTATSFLRNLGRV